MAAGTTTTSDISQRTAAFAAVELLKRSVPVMVLEKFGQAKTLPERKSKVIKFRRYEALDATPKTLAEGVTPSASKLTATDVTATLNQYGDGVTITDIVMDTHEDPVFQEAQGVLGEQAGQMIETVRYGIIKAGTNVYYANGAARTDVNTALSLDLQRRVTRALKRQNAGKITTVVRSTAAYGTQNVAPSYVCLCHPDCERDIRSLSGFTATENYGQITPYESEIGKVEDVRYISSTIFQPWADAGATKGSMLSTTGSVADVYPLLFLAKDAYGLVAFKGKFAVDMMVTNPKASDSDPWAQRGWVTWKALQTACILNDLWMVRAEVAVTA